MKKIIEQLPPDELVHILQIRKTRLENLLKIKEKALAAAPEGILRVIVNHGSYQYYHVTVPGTNGRYLPKSERALAVALAQKDYNKRVIPAIRRELAFVRHVLETLTEGAISSWGA